MRKESYEKIPNTREKQIPKNQVINHTFHETHVMLHMIVGALKVLKPSLALSSLVCLGVRGLG